MRTWSSFIVSMSLAAAGCSDEGTKPVTTGVGPAGGTVEGVGAVLTIPNGALAEQTDITITQTEEALPTGYLGASSIYQFTPEGLTFAMPVEVRIDFDTSMQGVQLVWSTVSGDGFELRGGSIDGSTLIGQVEHFSRGFAGKGVSGDACSGCAPGQLCQQGVCVALTECNDGLDNDSDGAIDANDSACMYNDGRSETLPQL